MKNIIKAVPIPLAGVMLGFAALGNLLQSYSETVRLVCGGISGMLLILILLKLICFPGMVKEDMKNPVMASVSGTFSMGLMLLAVYMKPLIGAAAKYVWYLAVILHIVLIIYFTVKFMLGPVLEKVFASYFIVYVGIAAAAVTAPAFEQMGVGAAAFWFGFVTFLLLLILVTVRYALKRDIKEPVKPLFCIYAAPGSLCLAGYIQSVIPKSIGIIYFLLVLSSVIYVIALVRAIMFLKLPFYPSCAAFTFPFVISAIAVKQSAVCLENMGKGIPWLAGVVTVETVIAAVLCVYTLVRFLVSISNNSRSSRSIG